MGPIDIDAFALTDEEVARRKTYLEMTADDERRLKKAHPLIQAQAEQIIERFYDYLLGHEHTRSLLSAPRSTWRAMAGREPPSTWYSPDRRA